MWRHINYSKKTMYYRDKVGMEKPLYLGVEIAVLYIHQIECRRRQKQSYIHDSPPAH